MYIKYQVIFKYKDKYSISEMCRFFEVSRSGYYAYLKRKDIPDKDLPLAEKIMECQEESHRTYGYRRVHIWLERQGIQCNPKTVLRVMQKYNLLSVVRRKKFHYVSNNCIDIRISLTENSLLKDRIRNGLLTSHTSKHRKDFCTCLSFVICMTTVLLPTKQQESNLLS